MTPFLFRSPSRRFFFRRRIIAVLVGFVVLMATASPAVAQQDDVDLVEDTVREIVFPAVGPISYSDTFGACRGFRCSRSHKGSDLFGVKLAPLVASADGTITFVRRSASTTAGNTVIVTDDEGWRYLYLHLNNDSPGTDDGANPQAWIIPNRLNVGDRVEAGDVIGYLGDSGNAERTPAHLHFEIRTPKGVSINPTKSLQTAQSAGRVISVASLASTAEGRAEYHGLVSAWYRALLKRDPSKAELVAWSDRFDIGFATKDDLIADLTMAPPRRDAAGAVYRSYHLAFGRQANLAEFRAWLKRYESDGGTAAVIGGLLASSEWTDRHGPQADGPFVKTFYQLARGRTPADRVYAYWTGQLNEGRSRGSMAAYFVDSYQVKNDTWHELEVTQAYRAGLDRLPIAAELEKWVAYLDDGGLLADVVDTIRG